MQYKWNISFIDEKEGEIVWCFTGTPKELGEATQVVIDCGGSGIKIEQKEE